MADRPTAGRAVRDWPRGSVHGAHVFDPGAAMSDFVEWRGKIAILGKPNIEGRIIGYDDLTWKTLNLSMFRIGTPVGIVKHIELHPGFLWAHGQVSGAKLMAWLRKGKTIGVDPVIMQRTYRERGRGAVASQGLELTSLDVVQNPVWSECIISAA